MINTRICLIGPTSQETTEIHGQLISLKYTPVDVFDETDLASNRTAVFSGMKYCALVFNFAHFGDQQAKTIIRVRQFNPNTPILVMAKSLTESAGEFLKTVSHAVLLEKPYKEKKFAGILAKLSNGHRVLQQIQRRFPVDVPATIEFVKQGVKIQGKVSDLSKSGAFVEADTSHIHVGELLKIDVALGDVTKGYSMVGTVVWVRNSDSTQGKRGFGFKMITSNKIDAA